MSIKDDSIDREIRFLKQWKEEAPANGLAGFREGVKAWADVVEQNTPVGPPHKKKSEEAAGHYYEGKLRDSVTVSFEQHSKTEMSAEITIGTDAPYWKYPQREWQYFKGQPAAMEEIDYQISEHLDGRGERHA